MIRKIVLASLAVFVAWSLLDYLMHGVILKSAYESTHQLWRPPAEMRQWLLHFVTLVSAVVFVCIYTTFFRARGIGVGIGYGVLFGLGVGISMGYGSYAVMPIPYNMALTWFLGTILEGAVGGALVGATISK